MLGFEPVGKEWNGYVVENEPLDGQTTARFSSLSELAGNVIPEITTRSIEKLLNIGETIVTQVIVNHQIMGAFTMMMPGGKHFENDNLVKIYCRQIDAFITRVKAEAEIIRYADPAH